MILHEKKEKKALETFKDYLEKKLDTSHLAQQDFYQYKIDQKTGKLVPSSLDSQLYLSLRYLWKMRYEEADIFLRRFDSFLHAYTVQEIEILKEIQTLASISGDQDPRMTTLALYASYLMKKNSVDFPSFPSKYHFESFNKDIKDLYSTYLNQLNNIFGVRLKPSEELFLLKLIPFKDEAIINRFIQLDPIKGKIAQAQFSQIPPPPFFTETFFEKSFFMEENFEFLFFNSQQRNWGIEYLRDQEGFLHKDLILDIDKIHNLIKVSNPSKKQRIFYKSFTGLSFPQEPLAWKKELASILRMITVNSSKRSQLLAWVFLASLEHPEEISIKNFIDQLKEENYKEAELFLRRN